MSKLITIKLSTDGKWVSIKFPSRAGKVWITQNEYLGLQEFLILRQQTMPELVRSGVVSKKQAEMEQLLGGNV